MRPSLRYPYGRSLRCAERVEVNRVTGMLQLEAREKQTVPCGEKKNPSQFVTCKGLISLVRPARFERTAFSSGV